MLELITEASALGAVLEETRGVVGVVLASVEGDLRAIVGSVADGDVCAIVAAALTGELNRVGSLLGLGTLDVASLKAASAARVFAAQAGTVVGIELDPKRPLGELETKLRTVAWAPDGNRLQTSPANRAPPVPEPPRAGPTGPPGLPAEARSAPPAPALPAVPRFAQPTPGPALPAAPRSAQPTPALSAVPRSAQPTPAPALPAAPRSAQPTPAPALPLSPPRSAQPTPAPTVPLSPPRPAPPLPAPGLPAPELSLPSATAARSSPAGGFPSRATAPSVALPSQMKSVGSGPVFTGDLEEFCLPDLLEFLRNSHRTGLLVCTTDLGVGTVQLSRGMIIGADSPNALDLRDYFLTSPELAPERRSLLAALPHECFGDDMIEAVLVSRDLVARHQVEQGRIARIYSAFREMMGWTAGRFSFDPAVPIVTNPALALSAQSILMQIYQEQDEQDEQGR